RLGGVLDGAVEPDVAIELEPVADQKAGRSQHLRIGRGNLVAGQHLLDHAIVRLVLVDRFDDPVAPAPDVWLAVADLGAVAGPVAVAPYVHPVPAPALAVV